MGKKLIIPNANFSENALAITTFKTVSPNTSFQIKDSTVINAQSNANGLYQHEGVINYSGSVSAITFFNVLVNSTQPTVEEIRGLRLKTSAMNYGFSNCNSLKKVIFADFEQTQQDIQLNRIFEGDTNIEELVFPTHRRISVSKLNFALHGVTKLKKLDLSMFDTQNLDQMPQFMMGMSGEAIDIEELNLSGWDLSSLDISVEANVKYAFYGTIKLTKVIVNDCDSTTITKLITLLGANSTLSYTQSTDTQGNTVLIGA